MLDLIYFSNVSENTHRFALNMKKFADSATDELNIIRIPVKGMLEEKPTKPFLLVCPSYGSASQGHVPPQVKKFLSEENARNLCAGVIGCGNLNFGAEFAASGDKIAQRIQKPLLYRFELAGFDTDIEKIFRLLNMEPEQLTQRGNQQND